jgi:hypothetical protein
MELIQRLNKLKIPFIHPSITKLPMPCRVLLSRVLGEAGTNQRFIRFGLRPLCIKEVSVEDLLVQRPVRCEMIPVKEATTLKFLDEYFAGENSVPHYDIYGSMQYKLLRAYVEGTIQDFSQTDYWQWHVKLRQAGINEDKRSDAWIADKIQRLLRVYESIKDRGYDYSRLSNYIWVVNEPLISTRYGYNYHPDGFEIFDGHHRAASVACLGYRSVYVLLVKDAGTHTPFGVPLDEIVTPTRG